MKEHLIETLGLEPIALVEEALAFVLGGSLDLEDPAMAPERISASATDLGRVG